MSTKFHDAINTYEGRHRRTVERAYDLMQHLFETFHVGKHRMTDIRCDFCGGLVVEPVRDAEEVSWLGKGASTFCSQACLDAHDEQRINAAGNEAS